MILMPISTLGLNIYEIYSIFDNSATDLTVPLKVDIGCRVKSLPPSIENGGSERHNALVCLYLVFIIDLITIW